MPVGGGGGQGTQIVVGKLLTPTLSFLPIVILKISQTRFLLRWGGGGATGSGEIPSSIFLVSSRIRLLNVHHSYVQFVFA